MMEHFIRILHFNNRHVNIQLIQTTSIFLQNISQETKRYYILCHPFLNKLIEFNFNFYDEELVDIYVSFIKSLALLLNENSIQFFYNQKNKHFPLLVMAQKFANHPETMVRNAVRIINLTVFKINDRKLNEHILSDLPYCLSFVHTACLLRDKVCNGIDKSYSCQNYIRALSGNLRGTHAATHSSEIHSSSGPNQSSTQAQQIENRAFVHTASALSHSPVSSAATTAHSAPADMSLSHSGSENPNGNNMLLDFIQALAPDQSQPGTQLQANQMSQAHSSLQHQQQSVKFDKLLDQIEDVEDILEYIQEIFEIENATTRKFMCNALLHYFYVPVIAGSLTGSAQEVAPGSQAWQVSANTALFILNMTFKMVHFQPFTNAICIALLAKEGPERLINSKQMCYFAPPSSGQGDLRHPVNEGYQGLGQFATSQACLDLISAPPTFSPRWKYRLPSQFKASDIGAFLSEYYNQSCVENFMLDAKFERCVFSTLYNKVSGVEYSVEAKKSQRIKEHQERRTAQHAAGAQEMTRNGMKGVSRSDLTESPPFSQTPDSDKFVIQDSELKNQQAYLSLNQRQPKEVNEFRTSKEAKLDGRLPQDGGIDQNSQQISRQDGPTAASHTCSQNNDNIGRSENNAREEAHNTEGQVRGTIIQNSDLMSSLPNNNSQIQTQNQQRARVAVQNKQQTQPGQVDYLDEEEPEQLSPEAERRLYIEQLYHVLFIECPSQKLIAQNQILQLELQHLVLSYALGHPVGLVKTQVHSSGKIRSFSLILERNLLGIQSIIDLQYEHMFAQVLSKTSSQSNTTVLDGGLTGESAGLPAASTLVGSEHRSKQVKNSKRGQIMSLIYSASPSARARDISRELMINDQLVLQVVGTFALFLSKCEGVSQCLLYHEKLYPIGYGRKKLISQKLLNDDTELQDAELKDSREGTDEIDEIKMMQEKHQNDSEQLDKQYIKLLKLQEQFENTIMYDECQKSIECDDELISAIICALQRVDLTEDMSQQCTDIVRIFTFKSICMLLIYLTYNKKLEPCSLKPEHLSSLLKAYRISIENLKLVMRTNMAEIVPEVLEEEFNQFKLNLMMDTQLDQIEDLMSNPLIMLPSINDRQINRRVPSQLTYSRKAIEILSNKIQIFLALRQIVNILGGNSIAKVGDRTIIDSGYAGIDVNPIAREVTVIHSWERGGSYQLPSVNVELILCNQRVDKKMCVRYVMIDPEFFILIEPDFSVQNENRIIIHQKVPLRHVESLVDRSDPRNLVIGFAVFFSAPKSSEKGSQGPRFGKQATSRGGSDQNPPPVNQFTTQEILLYFENTSKCTYVKNMLDHTKKTFKQQQISKANAFFDKCLKQYGLQ